VRAPPRERRGFRRISRVMCIRVHPAAVGSEIVRYYRRGSAFKMKFISCAIWLLSALLLTATLDAQPDPPAVNPNAAACKILLTHDYSGETAIQRWDSLAAFDPRPLSLFSADIYACWTPAEPVVLTGQAADSSPPLHV
jgi:hypothetical protein